MPQLAALGHENALETWMVGRGTRFARGHCMGHARRTWLLAATTFGLLAACAAGEEDTIGNPPVARSEENSTSTTLPPPAAPASSGDVAVPETGADAGPDAVADTGTPMACGPATNTCSNARDLGIVRADEGADVVTASGAATTWFKVRVKEGDTGGPGGKRMKIRATVTSPPGANFDVFVHLAGDGSSTNCTTPTASSTASVSTEEARVEWGETNFFNNEVDDRWVNIEVRWVSGTCSPTSTFTLTVNRW